MVKHLLLLLLLLRLIPTFLSTVLLRNHFPPPSPGCPRLPRRRLSSKWVALGEVEWPHRWSIRIGIFIPFPVPRMGQCPHHSTFLLLRLLFPLPVLPRSHPLFPLLLFPGMQEWEMV